MIWYCESKESSVPWDPCLWRTIRQREVFAARVPGFLGIKFHSNRVEPICVIGMVVETGKKEYIINVNSAEKKISGEYNIVFLRKHQQQHELALCYISTYSDGFAVPS